MKLNQQAPEKRATGDGTVIAVNSIFHTIQGEGPFAGTPAVFIRLAGCNLQCPLCDTEYSKRTDMEVNDIAQAAWNAVPQFGECLNEDLGPPYRWERYLCDLVVITGGEPFRQKLQRLATVLLEMGYRVQIETNGSYYEEGFPYEHPRVTVVCSPKTGAIHRKLLRHIAAFKYVATADSLKDSPDGLPMRALDHTAAPMLYRPPQNEWHGEIYLQPVDEQNHYPNKFNQDAVVESCMRHGYRLCLQTHKIIGVP